LTDRDYGPSVDGCSSIPACRRFDTSTLGANLTEDYVQVESSAERDHETHRILTASGAVLDLFSMFSRYFWILSLVVTAFNYLSSERVAAASGSGDPRASDEARVLRRQLALVSALPWIVMGLGMVAGGVPDVWHYFRPQDQNPYVLMWYCSIFFVSTLFAAWVFFRDGAVKTVKYQLFGTRSGLMRTVGRAKFFAMLGPIWIALWIAMVVSMNVLVPH
jgi:hypothetical protein